jgi:hypothetical protein
LGSGRNGRAPGTCRGGPLLTSDTGCGCLPPISSSAQATAARRIESAINWRASRAIPATQRDQHRLAPGHRRGDRNRRTAPRRRRRRGLGRPTVVLAGIAGDGETSEAAEAAAGDMSGVIRRKCSRVAPPDGWPPGAHADARSPSESIWCAAPWMKTIQPSCACSRRGGNVAEAPGADPASRYLRPGNR